VGLTAVEIGALMGARVIAAARGAAQPAVSTSRVIARLLPKHGT